MSINWFFSQDFEFTKNRAYHAAAISFFLHPELPLKYPDMKDAVHAGRMAIFKHPMNFKELCLPPCVGDGAYTEEEHRPSVPMDADGRQSRGIPESAVSRRLTRPRNAAAVAAASTASPAAAGPRAGQGPAAAAA